MAGQNSSPIPGGAARRTSVRDLHELRQTVEERLAAGYGDRKLERTYVLKEVRSPRSLKRDRFRRHPSPARGSDKHRARRSERHRVNRTTGELRWSARVAPPLSPAKAFPALQVRADAEGVPRDFANNFGTAPQGSSSPLAVERLAQLRADRIEALSLLWKGSAIPRVSRCLHTPAEEAVTLRGSDAGAVRIAGVQTCGSVWACPVCSARRWAKRATELEAGLNRWDAQGGRVYFATLTMRHAHGDRLSELWDALARGWHAITDNAKSRRVFDENGVAGWSRVVEVTVGANGWHVHVHAIFLLDPEKAAQYAAWCAERGKDAPPKFPAAAKLGDAIWSGWESGLEAAALSPRRYKELFARSRRTGDRSALLRFLRDAFDARESVRASLRGNGGFHGKLAAVGGASGEIGRYLAKGYYPSLAKELTGASGKKAGKGNLSHFGILAAMAAGDELAPWTSPDGQPVRLAELWHEFEVASHNRKAISYGKGTKAALGIRDDDDADENAEPVSWGYILGRVDWRRLCEENRPALYRVLRALAMPEEEARQAELDRILDPLGVLYLPLRS